MKKQSVLILFAITLQTIFFPKLAFAHLDEHLLPVKLVVAEWANAYQGDNLDDMGKLLSNNFNGSPQGKKVYLARLPYLPVKKVILRYANYRITHDSAVVSTIVHVPYQELNIPFSLSMTLNNNEGVWKIASIKQSDKIPEELQTNNHPLQHITHEVNVSLKDKISGEKVYARINIEDASGDYWPPQGHRKEIAQGWREDIGGDVVVAGKTYAYVTPDFILPLPEGKYKMEVLRGPEYEPFTTEFSVSVTNIPKIDIELQRWTNMAAKGWYSGDTHTHFLDPQTAMLEARGEDLNVVNVLASSGGNLITSVNHFTGKPSVFSDEKNIVYIAEETRHDYLGHTVLLNLQNFVFPFGWGGPHTGTHNGYDYPTMAHQADKAHENGALVAWSHLPHPHAELPIDVALDKVDAVETMVFGNPMEKHPVRVHMGDLTPEALSPMDLWYAILNTGFDMPALGSTDKMWNSQVSGSVRTYVKVEGDFTYQSWVNGIKHGKTFISSGPMIDFTFNGKEPGDNININGHKNMAFDVEVDSYHPVERIEIVVNGEVVKTLTNDNKQKKLSFKGNIKVDESAWVAARAYSSKLLPTQAHLTGKGSPVMAHTSPIYINVKGDKRTSSESAKYLLKITDRTIKWAETMARYKDDKQRKEVVGLYKKARAVYMKQVNE